MIRPTIDAPSFTSESAAGEVRKAAEGAFSLELELWIEVLLLIGVGLVMIYSASSIMALRKFGDAAHYFKRQIACIVLGIGTILVVSRFSYRYYRKTVPWMFLLTVLALTLVLSPGARFRNQWGEAVVQFPVFFGAAGRVCQGGLDHLSECFPGEETGKDQPVQHRVFAAHCSGAAFSAYCS